MKIYQEAQDALDAEMEKQPKRKDDDDDDDDDFATKVQIWQAEYNALSQEFGILQNLWHTVLQSQDQAMQTLANSAQQASQMASIIIQPFNVVAHLLQASL
jgi:hypothetical protein